MTGESTAVTRRGFLGMAMAAGPAASAVQNETGQTGNETGQTGNETGQAGNETGEQGTGAAQGGQTHTVDMTDELVFDPDSITIAPGDTIVWETVGSVGHSVTAYEDEIPDEAEYFASGGFESEDAARSAYAPGDPDSGDVAGGESYEHTFPVEGEYQYFCIPHETAGMVASLTVEPGGGAEGGGGEESAVPVIPEAAKSLAIAVSGALLAIFGFAYFFMKYGGDYVSTGPGEGD